MGNSWPRRARLLVLALLLTLIGYFGRPLSYGGQTRDVIYAATMTNRVHAIDAATGEWLWPEGADPNNIDPRNHGIYLGPPSPYFISIGSFCQDVAGPVGVLSTLVIDRPTSTLFAVNLINNRYRTVPPS